jgi:lipid II:glycine glycyltransferase (peptidoglycan interpeptide bridge formation enzyme)
MSQGIPWGDLPPALQTRRSLELREIAAAADWDALVAEHPFGHPLQCWGWGELKQELGWKAQHLALFDGARFRGGAMVLRRDIPGLPLSVMYVPRGPVVAPDDREALQALAQGLRRYARSHRSMYCKVDPAWPSDTPQKLSEVGFRVSDEAIQVEHSYTIDLTQTEDTLLANMRSKTRQYIRRAEREDIEVVHDTAGVYLDACYAIYQDTARRGGFALRPRAYYEALFHRFPANRQYLYVARRHDAPLAFLWMVCAGRQAVELFGGMSDAGQEWKGNYLLKWHAIRQMKAAGYVMYDLHGRATEGIAQFKEGFGPQETSWIGAYDAIYYPLLYAGWKRGLPLARWVARHSGRALLPRAE